LARAKANTQLQYTLWHSSITRAVHEVEDNASSLLANQKNYQFRVQQRDIATANLTNVKRARGAGLVNGTAEVIAQLAQVQAQQEYNAAYRDQLLAAVNLIAALGGKEQ
jgi:outer membrane protein TolC